MTESNSNVEWVLDKDDSYYGMFCVHPKDDTAFNSPRRFHFAIRKDAEKFLELISICHCAVPNDCKKFKEQCKQSQK